MREDAAVQAAIERWRSKGLLPDELADRLRDEVAEAASGRGRRIAQLVVAVTAGVVLLTASLVFLARSWSDFEVLTRTFILGGVGVALLLAGAAMERRPRVRPVGYVLQTSGLLMLLFSYVHSDQTWSAETPGGVLVGIIALLTPIWSVSTSIRRDPVMPAVNAAIGYAFLAFFLERIGVSEDGIVWILDGVLFLALLVLAARLRAAGPDAPGVATALYAFVASLLAGLVLAGSTAAGPLDAGGDTIFALDLWLALVVGLALWATHRAPGWIRRDWYADVLAACVVLATVFAFLTLDELGVPSDLLGVGGAAVGALALFYGVRQDARSVLLTGSLAIVVSVWIFGLEQGGSLGAVAALVFTAGLLFWVSTRLGGDRRSGVADDE